MRAVPVTYRVRAGLLVLVACALLLLGCVVPADAAEGNWPSFRPDTTNNAVVDAPTPTSAQHAAVRWATSLGTGWDASPTPPILANGKLIVLAGKTVYELDPQTGAVLRAQAVLASAPSFAYTPPTYADGVIYAPLSGGIIQAIDATTLESLWTYRDDLGGQNWVAPTVKDGLVYGGFYTSDTGEVHFVCLRAKAGEGQAAGSEVWSYTAKGGFYWSNPLIVGSSVIVGTGDGVSGDAGTGHLVSLDRKTGKVVSDLSVAGDVHATPVYDTTQNAVFFTTTPGWLYRAQVDAQTGTLSSPKRVRVGIHCTTTPVLYDGCAYVGTSEGFSGGKLVCVDEQSMAIRYQADLGGPMQSSPVLSTAELAQTGKVALYCTINNAANGLKVVTVAPDATAAGQAQVSELYDEAGHEQYGICSPIVASDGTIIYKNDSGTLFAVTPTDDAEHARVVSLIQAIGTVDSGAGARIAAARTAYDALPESAQAAIPNYGTLKRAERSYAQLKKSQNATKKAAEKTGKKAASKEKRQRQAKNARSSSTHTANTATRTGSAKRQKQTTATESATQAQAAPASATASAAPDSRSQANRPSAKAGASHRSGTKAKAKSASNEHKQAEGTDNDAPAATAALPADQEARPSWIWLAIIGAAAAALVVLAVYRVRTSRKGR